LWTSTNMGLVEFSIEQEAVVNAFDISHGIQNNEFNQNGYYKSPNGEMYFGGVNGYNVFYPDSIKGNKFIPDVVITGLSILNRPVSVGPNSDSGEFTLEKSITELDEINLSWEHDVITLDFAALSYISPEKNKYRYKLEGFKDAWVESGYNRSVTYTNLDPGEYIFQVQASNSSGLWNTEGTSMLITISTPPWASWYAYLVYLSLIIGVIYLIIRSRIRLATQKIKIQSDLEKARIEEREEFRKRSSQDFHDETGIKITRISLITELAKRNVSDSQQVISYLDKIEENIQSLNSGMRDFIWVLDPANDNFYKTLSRFSEFADKFCQYADIQFKMSAIPGSLLDVSFNMTQRRHLLFMLKETLNNAIKYSEANLIEFNVDVKPGAIHISLSDNGVGFEMAEKSSGNGLRNLRDRAKAIHAEVEIKSERSLGTKIIISILTPNFGKVIL
jgi:signal transduction histidine kinase